MSNYNPNDKPDPRVGRFLDKISDKIGLQEEVNTEKRIPRNNLENEIADLRDQIEYLTEVVMSLTSKTIISEGDGDTVDLILKGHHFRGKMAPVKK
jgi:hypothetical protein